MLRIRRSRTDLVAFWHPKDERWHTDHMDATQPTVVARASCGIGPTLGNADFKQADAVRPTDLCPSCWDVEEAHEQCASCRSELDTDTYGGWCTACFDSKLGELDTAEALVSRIRREIRRIVTRSA